MKNRCPIWFLLGVTILASHATAAAQQLHPKLKSKEVAIRKVIILPPKIEIVRQGMKGGEGMLKESAEVSAAVHKMVAQAFRDKKMEALDGPSAPEAAQENETQRHSLADVQNRYDTLAANLFKKPKDVNKGRFTMGDEVVNFNPDGAADALVFIRGSGTELTGGKKTFGILVYGATRSSLFFTISLVDARTGDVLYLANVRALGNIVKETEKTLAKPLAKSLKKLPAAL